MESEKKNYCSKYLKVVMAVLLAAALFYSGMKDYVKVGKTDTAVVELYGDYPAVNLAKQIWEIIKVVMRLQISVLCGMEEFRWLRIQRILDRQMPG